MSSSCQNGQKIGGYHALLGEKAYSRPLCFWKLWPLVLKTVLNSLLSAKNELVKEVIYRKKSRDHRASNLFSHQVTIATACSFLLGERARCMTLRACTESEHASIMFRELFYSPTHLSKKFSCGLHNAPIEQSIL